LDRLFQGQRHAFIEGDVVSMLSQRIDGGTG
jgi:hypothetical protein